MNKTPNKFPQRNIIPIIAIPVLSIMSILIYGIFASSIRLQNPRLGDSIIYSTFAILATYIIIAAYTIHKREKISESIYLSKLTSEETYQTTVSELNWWIEDSSGSFARFVKKKTILSNKPITHLYEYVWGSGEIPSNSDIQVEPHSLGPIKKQGSQYVIPIILNKKLTPGDQLEIKYSRIIKNAFCNDNEWVESRVFSKVDRIILNVYFPKDRSPLTATAYYSDGKNRIQYSLGEKGDKDFYISTHSKGGRCLHWAINNPTTLSTYTITWKW